MALVNVLSVEVLDNPAPFGNPFQFEITFEAIAPLEDDLEWKLIYVGSAESSQYDQELDAIMVGPVPVGVNKFVFQANAPAVEKIPVQDVVGVTVLLLTCSYFGREFIRIGYYVNNDYQSEELRMNPPDQPQYQLLLRTILADKPRVTRFPIHWTREVPALECPPVEGNPDEEPAELEIIHHNQQQQQPQEMWGANDVDATRARLLRLADRLASNDASLTSIHLLGRPPTHDASNPALIRDTQLIDASLHNVIAALRVNTYLSVLDFGSFPLSSTHLSHLTSMIKSGKVLARLRVLPADGEKGFVDFFEAFESGDDASYRVPTPVSSILQVYHPPSHKDPNNKDSIGHDTLQNGRGSGYIEVLDLDGRHWFTDDWDATKPLSTVIQKGFVRGLSLVSSHASFTWSEEQFRRVVRKELEYLDVSGMMMTSDMVAWLSFILQDSKMGTLNVNHTTEKLREKDIVLLAHGLAVSNVRHFSMNASENDQNSVGDVFLKELNKNHSESKVVDFSLCGYKLTTLVFNQRLFSSLKSLSLTDAHINDTVLRTFLTSLSTLPIESLNLSRNSISEEGLLLLLANIPTTLVSLNLHGNKIASLTPHATPLRSSSISDSNATFLDWNLTVPDFHASGTQLHLKVLDLSCNIISEFTQYSIALIWMLSHRVMHRMELVVGGNKVAENYENEFGADVVEDGWVFGNVKVVLKMRR